MNGQGQLTREQLRDIREREEREKAYQRGREAYFKKKEEEEERRKSLMNPWFPTDEELINAIEDALGLSNNRDNSNLSETINNNHEESNDQVSEDTTTPEDKSIDDMINELISEIKSDEEVVDNDSDVITTVVVYPRLIKIHKSVNLNNFNRIHSGEIYRDYDDLIHSEFTDTGQFIKWTSGFV